ncbi:MAG TPA: V-type ATPase subunit [Sedimentisphaerales bacterium]|nr:V-type ATPase subunit [Sedimentisphaerales bacterium]
MTELAEQAILDFYTYPPIGGDDWRYTYQTAQVRTLEMQMFTRATLLDMANAANFQQAADSLSGTEYTLPQGGRNFAEVQEILQQRRTAMRELFSDLMLDEPIVELLKTRDDFANLRLAVRRTLTEIPIGTDYSSDGNVPPEMIEQIFAEEDEFNKPVFPDYVRDAVEQAVLAYYQNKDIRRIDDAIDQSQAGYNLKQARRLKSVFLTGLFKIQIDLTNIRTMLRLKFTDSEQRNVFLKGGFIELERFMHGLELGYEALGSLFFVTPYHRIVEIGANYLASDKSFLKVEQQCEEHVTGFLKSTVQVTAGPQPIIAYLLMKENEIRTVKLILTAKKNNLDTKLILDRIT